MTRDEKIKKALRRLLWHHEFTGCEPCGCEHCSNARSLLVEMKEPPEQAKPKCCLCGEREGYHTTECLRYLCNG